MATTEPPTPSGSPAAQRPPATAADPAARTAAANPSAVPTTPVDRAPGVVRRTTTTIKRVLLVALGALVALFAVLNSQNVEVRWIFGHPIQTPLIVAIAVTFVAGAAIGWLVAKLGARNSAGSTTEVSGSGRG